MIQKRSIIIFVLICVGTLSIVWGTRAGMRDFLFKVRQGRVPKETPAASTAASSNAVPVQKEPKAARSETSKAVPQEINLPMPFTSQAPHANWALPYQEACEEVSLIMAAAYARGTPSSEKGWTKDEADAEILKLVKWQEENLGFYKDTTADETARVAREYFGLKNVRVVENPSAEDIRNELRGGRVVIVPAYGKALGNPNFRNNGPLYHMLVVKGYILGSGGTDNLGAEKNKFITNDPGTRRGRNYIYKESVIMNAMHDWNNGDVQNGAKRAVIIGK